MKAYEPFSVAESKELATLITPSSTGLESSEDILQWIWDSGFAAVAGDNPAFGAWPCRDKRYWLHEWSLAGWGLPTGELSDLEKPATKSKKAQKSMFFTTECAVEIRGPAPHCLKDMLLTWLLGSRRSR